MVHRCSNYVGHTSSALTAGWKDSGEECGRAGRRGGGREYSGESFVKRGAKFIFAHSLSKKKFLFKKMYF